MAEFWSGNWSDFGAIIGIAVSFIGLGWAIWEARGAKSASLAAQEAATETSNRVAQQLQAVDLQRAIGMIGSIKTLHDNKRWEGSTELYQTLRGMLSDVIVRCPVTQPEIRGRLATSRILVRDMENNVRARVRQGISEREKSDYDQELNAIQSDLEELASFLSFGGSQGVTE